MPRRRNDPDHIAGHSGLCHQKRRDALREWLQLQSGLQAELALAELDEITRCQESTDALEKRLATRVKAVAPALLAIPGCGIVSAATLVGESANVDRFKDEAAFASFGGLDPIARWSGGSDGARGHEPPRQPAGPSGVVPDRDHTGADEKFAGWGLLQKTPRSR